MVCLRFGRLFRVLHGDDLILIGEDNVGAALQVRTGGRIIGQGKIGFRTEGHLAINLDILLKPALGKGAIEILLSSQQGQIHALADNLSQAALIIVDNIGPTGQVD